MYWISDEKREACRRDAEVHRCSIMSLRALVVHGGDAVFMIRSGISCESFPIPVILGRVLALHVYGNMSPKSVRLQVDYVLMTTQ